MSMKISSCRHIDKTGMGLLTAFEKVAEPIGRLSQTGNLIYSNIGLRVYGFMRSRVAHPK
jgi:hypothetical protein